MAGIKDVAREANVSIATVSRVMNNSAKVSEDTRLRIIKAMRSLGYRPPVSQKNNQLLRTVGLLVPNMKGNHYGEIFMGIEDCLNQYGFDLLTAVTRNMPDKETAIINEYFQRKVDGILVCTLQSEEHLLDKLINIGVPAVAIDYRIGEIKADSVNIDNVTAAYQVGRYLYKKGHRKIFVIPGPKMVYSSQDREKGIKNYAEKHQDMVLSFSEIRGFEPEHGYMAMVDKLKRGPVDFSVVFSFNDHISMGAIKAMNEAGIKIPNDISVMGFDDSLFAAYTVPALTTVSQPTFEMGSVAANFLIERLTNNKPRIFRNILLPAKIVERESVKDINKEI